MNLEFIKNELKSYRKPKYDGFLTPPNDESINTALNIIDQLIKSGLNLDKYSPMADGGVSLHVSFGLTKYQISVENDDEVLVLTIKGKTIDENKYIEFFIDADLINFLTNNIN